MIPQIALAIGPIGVLTSSIGVGLSGRVSPEVSSDMCMGEGSQI